MKIKIIFFVFALWKTNLLCSQINLSNGLLAHYPFSGNANDISGNNFNAVNFGATLTTDAKGNSNSAYEFNGIASHILLPSNTKFNFAPTDSFTISCWVQPYQNLNWNNQALLVKSSFDINPQNANWSYGLYVAIDKAMSGYANNSFLNATTALQQNKCWYHLVVTYKNGIWHLYVNGKLEAQDLSQTKFITQDASVTSVVAIGKKGGAANGDYYKGKLDEVRIYDRNLSNLEVDALYQLDKSSANFSFSQELCNPKQIVFKNETPNTANLYWNFGNGNIDSNKNQIVATYSNYNTYNVQLTTIDNNGCNDSVQKTVPVYTIHNPALITNKNDSLICLGKTGQLKMNAIVTGNFCWSSSNNSLNGSINNPAISPTTNTTYYLTSQTLGNNLIVNGDFEQGNTGFVSDYTYFPGTAGGVQSIYNILNNPNVWLSAFAACNDHTEGTANDKMMMLDGSTTAGKDFWKQSITIKPNTNYNISFWLQSIVAQNPAVIKLKINGTQIGSTITADNTTCTWKNFSTQWFSGASTLVTISLEDLNTVVQGNDFAIDDISFSETTLEQDSIIVNVKQPSITNIDKTVCFGNSINGHTTTGNYADKYINAVGCDSIVNLKLTVLPAPISTKDTITGCGSVVVNGITYYNNQLVSTTIKNYLGCDSIITQHQIEVLTKPSNFINPKQITTCLGDKFSISGFDSYLWNTRETTATINLNGLNTYWVEVSNSNACVGRDTLTVIYNGKFEPSNVNAFSPNGDGVNDEFKPFSSSSCFTSYSLVIFNRWGQKLFESINPAKGWNGTLNDNPLPVGVYYYVLIYETATGIKKQFSSYVSLLR